MFKLNRRHSTLIFLPLLAVFIFLLGRESHRFLPDVPSTPSLVKSIPDLKLPKIDLLGSNNLNNSAPSASSTARLRLLSANLVGTYEQEKMGAMENSVISSLLSVFRFRSTSFQFFSTYATIPIDRKQANYYLTTENRKPIPEKLFNIQSFIPPAFAEDLSPTPSESPTPTYIPTTAAPTSSPIYHLKEIRIVGEVQNISQKIAAEPSIIVRFYAKNRKFIATKKAVWTSPYIFHPLAPDQTVLYDVTIKDPPLDSETVELILEPKTVSEDTKPTPEHLKIKGRDFTPKQYNQSGSKFTYYQLKGELTNTGDLMLEDMAIYTYVKDKDAKVIAVSYSLFPNDILEKDKTLTLFQNILPLREGEMSEYKVEVYGKEVKK